MDRRTPGWLPRGASKMARKLLGQSRTGEQAEQPAPTGEADADIEPEPDMPERQTTPTAAQEFMAEPVAMRADLRRCRWTPEGKLELTGWVFAPDRPVPAQAGIGLELVPDPKQPDDKTPDPVTAAVTPTHSAEANAVVSRAAVDYSNGTFVAEFDLADALQAAVGNSGGEHRYTTRITLDDGDRVHATGFTKMYRWGSAAQLSTEVFSNGLHIRPQWDPKSATPESGGLQVVAARRAYSAAIEAVSGPGEAAGAGTGAGDADTHHQEAVAVLLDTHLGDDSPVMVEFASSQASEPALTVPVHEGRAVVNLSQVHPHPGAPWYVYGRGPDGGHRHVHWQPGNRAGLQVLAGGRLAVVSGPSGVLRVDPFADSVVLEDAELEDQTHRLTIAGRSGCSLEGWQPVLRGKRDYRAGSIRSDGQEFRIDIDLLGDDAWGNSDLAPMSGGYSLELVSADGSQTVQPMVGAVLAHQLYRRVLTSMVACRIERHPSGQLYLDIRAPLADAELGRLHRDRLRAWAGELDTLQQAVYCESFLGKFAAGSPRAITTSLGGQQPSIQQFWGVRDRSVPYPRESTPVVVGSQDWWRLRATARWLITNDWLGSDFVKRPGQTVVQTWHGTAYKKLALDRPGPGGRDTFRRGVMAESGKWDFVLVENEYSAEIMSRAYAYHGRLLRSGYPRNDVLTGADGEQLRRRLRTAWGIRDDQTCVLYAPTWREENRAADNDLDITELHQSLGAQWSFLLRGHANTLRRGADRSAAGVLDVTSYPEAAHLFLVSDVLITDYSSVMFDYAVTGKPLLFFVPDLESYAGTERGAYFDLGAEAPGPLLRSTQDVYQVLSSLPDSTAEFTDRYRAWQQRFTPWDDGNATQRVLDVVFG